MPFKIYVIQMQLFLFIVAFMFLQQIDTQCPSGWFDKTADPFNCYYRIGIRRNCSYANETCMNLRFQPSLPTFNSLQEYNSYVNYAYYFKTPSTENHWIGLKNNATSFVWYNCSFINSSTLIAYQTNCIQTNGWTTDSWLSTDCSTLNKFACQIRLNPSPCPSGWISDGSTPSVCYLQMNGTYNYTNAVSSCTTLSSAATLPIFKTLTEYKAFLGLSYFITITSFYWMGYVRVPNSLNNSYEQVDGNQTTFALPWDTTNSNINESCVVMNTNGKWTNEWCNVNHSLVCQFRMPSYTICPTNWYYDPNYPNICYSNISAAQTWDNAQIYCNSLESYATPKLPMFKTDNELSSYITVSKSLAASGSEGHWVGMTPKNSKVMMWLDETSVGMSHWTYFAIINGQYNEAMAYAAAAGCAVGEGWTNDEVWIAANISSLYMSLCQMRLTNFSATAFITLDSNVPYIYANMQCTTLSTTTQITSAVLTTADLLTTTTVQGHITTTEEELTKTVEHLTTASILPTVMTEMNISVDVLSDPQSLTTTLQDVGPFLLTSLNSTTLQLMGQQLSDLVRICTYNKIDCSDNSNFQYLYNPTYGNCYSFNAGEVPKYTIPKQIGPDYGLKIFLHASQEDYSCSSEVAGFRISFQQNNLPVYPDSDGYNIPPGAISTFTLEHSRTTRLGKPYGVCADTSYQNSGDTYTVEDCLRKCFQSFAIQKCGCSDPRLPLTNINTNTSFSCPPNKKSCLDNINTCLFGEVMKQCDCPPPCKEVIYYPTITSIKLMSTDVYKVTKFCKSLCLTSTNVSYCESSFDANFAILYAYYSSTEMYEYDETASYELMNLLSDFSGLVGLLLGVCVITLSEVIVFFFYASTICCKK